MAITSEERWAVFRRDNFTCRYCGLSAEAGAVLVVDHVLPRVAGGTDDLENLATSCRGCNATKLDRMPDGTLGRLLKVATPPPPRRGRRPDGGERGWCWTPLGIAAQAVYLGNSYGYTRENLFQRGHPRPPGPASGRPWMEIAKDRWDLQLELAERLSAVIDRARSA